MPANVIAGRAMRAGDTPEDAITTTSLSPIILLYTNNIAIKVTNGTIIDMIKGTIITVNPKKFDSLTP